MIREDTAAVAKNELQPELMSIMIVLFTRTNKIKIYYYLLFWCEQ